MRGSRSEASLGVSGSIGVGRKSVRLDETQSSGMTDNANANATPTHPTSILRTPPSAIGNSTMHTPSPSSSSSSSSSAAAASSPATVVPRRGRVDSSGLPVLSFLTPKRMGSAKGRSGGSQSHSTGELTAILQARVGKTVAASVTAASSAHLSQPKHATQTSSSGLRSSLKSPSSSTFPTSPQNTTPSRSANPAVIPSRRAAFFPAGVTASGRAGISGLARREDLIESKESGAGAASTGASNGTQQSWSPTQAAIKRPYVSALGVNNSNATRPASPSYPQATDFSHDGGMGQKRTTLDAAMRNASPSNVALSSNMSSGSLIPAASAAATPSHPRGVPPHLSLLAPSLSASDSALRSHLHGLDLLSTAFAQLIGEVGSSKGHLSRLLERIRRNYALLFEQLVDSLLALHQHYNHGLSKVVQEYKQLQTQSDEKVAHLEGRVRLLTDLSGSKDALVLLGEEQIQKLEGELSKIKHQMTEGLSGVTVKVEQASHAILASAAAAEAKATAVATQKASLSKEQQGQAGANKQMTLSVSAAQQTTAAQSADNNQTQASRAQSSSDNGAVTSREEKKDGSMTSRDGATSASTESGSSSSASPATSRAAASSASYSSHVDSLSTLSSHSRNLCYELSELIQSVEHHQVKSAKALGALDRLLGQGTSQMNEIVTDVALQNLAMAGMVSGTGAAAGAGAGVGSGTGTGTGTGRVTGRVSNRRDSSGLTGPGGGSSGSSFLDLPSSPLSTPPTPLRGVERLAMSVEPSTPNLASGSSLSSPFSTPDLETRVLPGTNSTRASTASMKDLIAADAAAKATPGAQHASEHKEAHESQPSPSSSAGHTTERDLQASTTSSTVVSRPTSPRPLPIPSILDMQSASRWQYLRHLTEEAKLEERWTSSTQTDESITGFVNVLHIQEPSTLGFGVAGESTDGAAHTQAELRRVRILEKKTPNNDDDDPTPSTSSRPFPVRVNGFILPATLRDFLAPLLPSLVSSSASSASGEGGSAGVWGDEVNAMGLTTSEAQSFAQAAAHDAAARGPLHRRQRTQGGRSMHMNPATALSIVASAASPAHAGTSGGGAGVGGFSQATPVSTGTPKSATTPSLNKRASRSILSLSPSQSPRTLMPAPAPAQNSVGTPVGSSSPASSSRQQQPQQSQQQQQPQPKELLRMTSKRRSMISLPLASMPPLVPQQAQVLIARTTESSNNVGVGGGSGSGIDAAGSGNNGTGRSPALTPASASASASAPAPSDAIFQPLGSLRRSPTLDTRAGSGSESPNLRPSLLPRRGSVSPGTTSPLMTASSSSPGSASQSVRTSPRLQIGESAAATANNNNSTSTSVTGSPFSHYFAQEKEPTLEELNPAKNADDNRFAIHHHDDGPERELLLPHTHQAHVFDVLSVREVFDHLFALYEMYISNYAFHPTQALTQLMMLPSPPPSSSASHSATAATQMAVAASAAATYFSPLTSPSMGLASVRGGGGGSFSFSIPPMAMPAQPIPAATGSMPSNGLADLLIDYSFAKAGSVVDAPKFLASLLLGFMCLYKTSEWMRHMCGFLGIGHANFGAASSGSGVAAGADRDSNELASPSASSSSSSSSSLSSIMSSGGLEFSEGETLDVYARAIHYFRASKVVINEPKVYAPFDYESSNNNSNSNSNNSSITAPDPSTPPPFTYISVRSAEVFLSDFFSATSSVKVANIPELHGRVAQWIATHTLNRHGASSPTSPAFRPHVPLAPFLVRVVREYRMHVRNLVSSAANKVSPPLAFLGGCEEMKLQQWIQFLKQLNPTAAEAITPKPSVVTAMMRHFTMRNRHNNPQGDWRTVYANLLPVLRAAGFLAINIQHLLA